MRAELFISLLVQQCLVVSPLCLYCMFLYILITISSLALSSFWGMIAHTALIVHLPLLNLQYPANALVLFAVLIEVTSFELLPLDMFNE